MAALPNFEYYRKKYSKTLDIVLQGGDVGIDKPFIRKTIDTLKNDSYSVLAFNFLYYERGEDHSSGEELVDELQTLQDMMDFVHTGEFDHIRLIGKSLGGIVASFYLDNLPEDKQGKFSVVILGYVTGSLRLQNFTGPIVIIQGEKDKFGGIEKVKEDLKNAKSKDIKYFEVPGANHSFCDPETKEPVYVDDAMKVLSSL